MNTLTREHIESVIDSYSGSEPSILIIDTWIHDLYFSMFYLIECKTFFIFGYNGKFSKAAKDINFAVSLYNRIIFDFNNGIIIHSIVI